jgi:CRISPR type IV-associated protein Csf2
MTTGTPSTDISTSTSIPEVVRAARNDPFLNLFGGTPFMISSASVIAEGWPLLEATRGLMMTEPILTPMTLTKLEDMSEAVAIVRKNDVLDMTGKNLEKVISLSDLAQYFSKESDDRKASKQRRDEGETGTKTSLRSLNAFEAVLPGIAFSLRIELTSRSPSHLGMMLLAVQSFLRDGQVGGKAARGFGRFALAPNASRLYEVDPEQRNKLVLSSIFGDKSSGYEFVKSPVIVEAVDAAQDYIDDCNPGLYEAFTSANAHGIKAMQKAVAVA